jgi:hypothetical protein
MTDTQKTMATRWTMASIAAGLLLLFGALEKWPLVEPFFMFALGVVERIAGDWKTILGAGSILFGGLCGVGYPWFMHKDIDKAIAESRVRVLSGLITLLMGLVITWFMGRRADGVILSFLCAVGGPMFAMSALRWVMVKFKIIPAAMVHSRKEVAAIVDQMVASEKPTETPVILQAPEESE